MDVEEYVRMHLAAGDDEESIIKSLAERVGEIKRTKPAYVQAFSRAVVEEVKNTRGLSGDFFSFDPALVKMGEFGVGSRGKGDFFAPGNCPDHRQNRASVGVDEMDDPGAVRACGEYIVCTVDGMHSRLSDYPYLPGFHVTRATLRDLYVMGAKPVMLFSDIHVADDGDVAKIFDYTRGITTVGEAMNVPLVIIPRCGLPDQLGVREVRRRSIWHEPPAFHFRDGSPVKICAVPTMFMPHDAAGSQSRSLTRFWAWTAGFEPCGCAWTWLYKYAHHQTSTRPQPCGWSRPRSSLRATRCNGLPTSAEPENPKE